MGVELAGFVLLAVGVAEGTGVRVNVAVADGAGVRLGLGVIVGAGVRLGFGVEEGEGVSVGLGVGLRVRVGVAVGGSPCKINSPTTFHSSPTKIINWYLPGSQPPSGFVQSA